jgi:phenol/toluene 2-monooxygenase (NADH) P0/A0
MRCPDVEVGRSSPRQSIIKTSGGAATGNGDTKIFWNAWRNLMDTSSRYVRLSSVRADGYVEFVFSIGDPTIGVDLILSRAAYEEFCRVNRVTFVTPEQGAVIDFESAKWRFGRPGLRE